MTTMGSREAFDLWFKEIAKSNPKVFTKEFVRKAWIDAWDVSALVHANPNVTFSQSKKRKR